VRNAPSLSTATVLTPRISEHDLTHKEIDMRKTIIFVIVFAIVLFIGVLTAQSAAVPALTYYEAANQFSDNVNPNGTWSYGYSTKLGGAFHRYTINGFSDVGDGWYGYTLGSTPLLVTQSGIPATHLLTLHPGPADEQSVARWIAPSSATFNFLGFFYGLDPADGSAVTVLKNNAVVYSDVVSYYGDERDFRLSFPLRKGDKIDFVVSTVPGHASGGAYAGMGVTVAPQLFKFTAVEYPGVPNTAVFALNNLGDIVGRYRGTDDVRHGFMRHKGVYTTIDDPSAPHTFLNAINDVGQILGYTWDGVPNSLTRPFLLSNGTFTDVEFPGAVATGVWEINDLGYMVGYYEASNYGYVGFVRGPDGTYSSIEFPGSLSGTTFLTCINLIGQMAGDYQDQAYVQHGFLRNPNGRFITVDFPGATDGTALTGLNTWGGIAGVYYGLGGPAYNQSFVAEGSHFVPVWLPGMDYVGTQLQLARINDRGQVVGYYLDANNQYHSFTGTPIVPLR
jgi:hypothetical protein